MIVMGLGLLRLVGMGKVLLLLIIMITSKMSNASWDLGQVRTLYSIQGYFFRFLQ
ncbi:unnamed protein product [Eruca vesicaria subsp. sativa]|uniref:Uncharacterized protein n=1 Tax=Eruca vesicaria subsp. sativa TaxID=29727 RepID=A0ABC8KW54_ERUVS|nr:unnamed protein product [Eruca vesicaria subsp. sativa]